MYRENACEEYLVQRWGSSHKDRWITIRRFVGVNAQSEAKKWLFSYQKHPLPDKNFRVISIDDWILEGQS